jgi:hypothetical protein
VNEATSEATKRSKVQVPTVKRPMFQNVRPLTREIHRRGKKEKKKMKVHAIAYHGQRKEKKKKKERKGEK